MGIIKHLIVPRQLQRCFPVHFERSFAQNLQSLIQIPTNALLMQSNRAIIFYTSLYSSVFSPLLGDFTAYLTSFSSISLASLTLVARYGEPPRSGWFISMRDRCFLRRSSFVTPRSLMSVSNMFETAQVAPTPLTASQGSRQLLSVSSWVQSHPCRNCDPVWSRQHHSYVSQRAQRDPDKVRIEN